MTDYAIFDTPSPAELGPNQFKKRYPFDKLNVGQSFYINASENKTLSQMQTNSYYWQKKLGTRYRVSKNNEGTIQIARIA